MKYYKHLLTIIFVLFIVSKQKAQSVFTDSTLIELSEIDFLIDSIYGSKIDTSNYRQYICNKYVSINVGYFSTMELNYSDSVIKGWKYNVKKHKGVVIDSSFNMNISDTNRIKGVFFISYPYNDYVVIEFYLTIRYRGYLCSDIIDGKRLQLLFKNNSCHLSLIGYRIKNQTNICKFID